MVETVLIVDDDEATRDLLSGILTAAGYKVEQADGGGTALAGAAASPPDLILLDVLMPEMSGFQVCRRLKEHPATSAVPVIVVTALGEIRDKETALTSGADDFVSKPVRPDDLRARVSAMLKVRRIRQELDRTLGYILELEAARHAQRRESLASMLAVPSPQPVEASSASRVLLVDDEEITRQFYGDLLEDRGLRVFPAATGAEALALARQVPVDVVILDILMPEMSGLEVLERLQAQDPELPVIMLTAHATSQNAIAALKLGAFDFILKGLEAELVVMAVHRAIRYRRDTLHRKRETEQLRARIAELERGGP
jgi:two-component system cell cycle response regulator